jgi:stress response protein YsnF
LYDSRQDAESAKQRLSSAVDVENVQIFDQESAGSSSFGDRSSDSQSDDHQGGSWLSRLFLSDDDRPAFAEGVRRGGFMLCAEIDSDEDADRIVDILEQTSPVDLDERQQSWKSEGWQGSQGFGQREQSFGQSGRSFGESGQRTVEEERIPIVQEEMKIGKREVERGGARVRSYVRETPVSEQVNLREENVSVERRPVNEAVSENELDTSGMLVDREIEMRATGEEAVIGKDARATEELVVKKTAEERSETVQDSVRHTEVDVDGDRETLGSPRGTSGGSPWGNDGDR